MPFQKKKSAWDWHKHDGGQLGVISVNTLSGVLMNFSAGVDIPGKHPHRHFRHNLGLFTPERNGNKTVGQKFDFTGSNIVCVSGWRRLLLALTIGNPDSARIL